MVFVLDSMPIVTRDRYDAFLLDLDGTLLEQATGRGWIAARRPELYGLLALPTGRERDTRELKFEE